MSRQILTVFNQSVSHLLFNRFFRGFGGQRNLWHVDFHAELTRGFHLELTHGCMRAV
jgi:hypothetical protein